MEIPTPASFVRPRPLWLRTLVIARPSKVSNWVGYASRHTGQGGNCYYFAAKTTVWSVLHDAQLLLNKQQQIWVGVYIHWHISSSTDTVISPLRITTPLDGDAIHPALHVEAFRVLLDPSIVLFHFWYLAAFSIPCMFCVATKLSELNQWMTECRGEDPQYKIRGPDWAYSSSLPVIPFNYPFPSYSARISMSH